MALVKMLREILMEILPNAAATVTEKREQYKEAVLKTKDHSPCIST